MTNDRSTRWILAAALLTMILLVACLLYARTLTVSGIRLTYDINSEQAANEFVEPIQRRLDWIPDIQVAAVNERAIAIDVPLIHGNETEIVKDLIRSAGILRFLILANQTEHAAVIRLATEEVATAEGSPKSDRKENGERSEENGERANRDPRDVFDQTGTVVGRWVRVGHESTLRLRPSQQSVLRVDPRKMILRDSKTKMPIELTPELHRVDLAGLSKHFAKSKIDIEVLSVVDSLTEVRGEDLSYAGITFDSMGNPRRFVFADRRGIASIF